MRGLAKVLVGVSALTYCCAVAAKYVTIMDFTPGTFARASLGLAALAIAIVLVFEGPGASGSK